MPRVLYNQAREEIDHGGHPVGCNAIRVRVTPTSDGLVNDHWMVVLENGVGKVLFFPFDSYVKAENFFNSLFASKPRVLLDAEWEEQCSGGWNKFAVDTIRNRVNEAKKAMV